jgi:hypothetical protein
MTAALTGLLSITELRDAAAAALAPVSADDPPVLVDVVDSLTPPALMLLWGDPWLTPGINQRATMGPCVWSARLHVLCVAGRLEPGPGIRVIEGLVSLTVERMEADTYTWPLESVTAPRVFDLAGVAYLGARVGYLIPASVGGTSL